MWVFTKHGFFSAVCARQGSGKHGQPVDTNRIMVQARVRAHLESLNKRFADLLGQCEIQESTGTDYAFVIFVEKPVWSRVLAGLGPRQPQTHVLIEIEGELLAGQGRLAEARDAFAESYRLRRESLGPDHPETLVAAWDLVQAERAAGRPEAAEALQAEVLAPVLEAAPDTLAPPQRQAAERIRRAMAGGDG